MKVAGATVGRRAWGSSGPPESHKSFLSFFPLLELVTHPHPNATDAKNSPPPAVGQPLLHPNPMEASREWQAETLVLFSPLPVGEKESR